MPLRASCLRLREMFSQFTKQYHQTASNNLLPPWLQPSRQQSRQMPVIPTKHSSLSNVSCQASRSSAPARFSHSAPAWPSKRRPPNPHRGGSSTSSSQAGNGRRTGDRRALSEPQLSPAPVRARDILLKRKVQPAAQVNSRSSKMAAPAAAAAIAAVQQQVAAEQPSVEDPTFVPRNPQVTDGPWNETDLQLVAAAQQDAELATTKAAAGAAGAAGAAVDSSTAIAAAAAAAAAPAASTAGGVILLGKTAAELADLVQHCGQPTYRSKQLVEGVLQGAHSIQDIKNIPTAFRQQLQGLGVKTGRSVIHHQVKAPDGTQKLLLQLEEGRVIETVGIPITEDSKNRLTVCVSSQVGCPMRCTFCATGKGGFARNLRPHEIIDQVLTISEVFSQRVSNIVFMGMGEPLLNLPGVVSAYNYIKNEMGLSGRAITISTVGVPNAIRKLAEYKLTATLAVSIHAPNQALREQLIPSAKVYPIEALMQDCSSYFHATKRRVTFEYTLMAGTNDAAEHAEELADLLRRHNLMSHVNLIPWNPVDESDYRRPSRSRVTAFQKVLEAAGLACSIRTTRGLEAAAACGQLRNQYQKQQLESPQRLL